MAVYDLEEQEQISELKAWWAQHGKLTIALVVGLSAGFAGWQGWQYYKKTQSNEAAVIYENVQVAMQTQNIAALKDATERLTKGYASTGYASLAALVAARAHLDANDSNAARASLAWVAEHGSDPALRDLGRLRLAHVLFDEAAQDEALKHIAKAETVAFARRFADLRGDILMSQGKKDEARAAYQAALATQADGEAGQVDGVIRMKLDALSVQGAS